VLTPPPQCFTCLGMATSCFASSADTLISRASDTLRSMRFARKDVGHEIVVLGPRDEAEAVGVMTRSFNGTEASAPEKGFDWVAGVELRGKYEDPKRMQLFSFYMRWVFTLARKYGLLIGVRDARDGTLLAVTAVMPPGNALCALDFLSVQATPRMLRLIIAVGQLPPNTDTKAYPLATERLEALGKHLLESYKRLLPQMGGARGHWYVHLQAVDPSAQGRGCTRTSLDALAKVADADDRPCYIEANSDRNQAIYARLGYNTLLKEAIKLPAKLSADQTANPPPTPSCMLRPVGGRTASIAAQP